MNNPFGFVVIDKPTGLTSHDCVNRLRRVFGIKRIGHGGTLDPAVTGVLPIAIGKATRLLQFLPGTKAYQGIIQLGRTTSTDDIHGEILTDKNWPQLNSIYLNKVLRKFTGNIKQKPPRISSVHIKGERAYKRAHRGEVFELSSKEIVIHQLLLLNWNQDVGQLEIKVNCSSGTYIRSLARDLGEILGCGGCLAQLRRTQALGFQEEQCIKLPNLNNNNEYEVPEIVEPLEALAHLNKFKIRQQEELKDWRTGRNINGRVSQNKSSLNLQSDDDKKLFNFIAVIGLENELIGIGRCIEKEIIKPEIVFNAIG